MKKSIILIFFALIFFPNNTYAITEDILKEQKDNFGITNFINESKKYTDDSFETIDISDLLNSAISGKVDNNEIIHEVLNCFTEETLDGLKILSEVLAIIIIHSILKAISDGLENNNISQIIYYIQYILIVTIMTANFSYTIQMVKDTANNLVGFMNSLIPLLMSLMLFTGSIVTSSVVEPIILFIINILGNCINFFLIPIVLIIAVLSIISKISDKIQIEGLTRLLNSSVVWFIGIALTLFVATISLEGSLSSSVDGITAKTAKAAISSVIPVVGKILR